MNALCLLLGHQRSRGKARQDPVFQWRSVCARCGAPMVRLAPGKWSLESEAAAPRRNKPCFGSADAEAAAPVDHVSLGD